MCDSFPFVARFIYYGLFCHLTALADSLKVVNWWISGAWYGEMRQRANVKNTLFKSCWFCFEWVKCGSSMYLTIQPKLKYFLNPIDFNGSNVCLCFALPLKSIGLQMSVVSAGSRAQADLQHIDVPLAKCQDIKIKLGKTGEGRIKWQHIDLCGGHSFRSGHLETDIHSKLIDGCNAFTPFVALHTHTHPTHWR